MSTALQNDITWLLTRLDEIDADPSPSEMKQIRAIVDGMLAEGRPADSLESLDLEHIRSILKLLTIRFHLRNKAEQVHIARVNRRREREATPETPRPESLDEAVGALHRDGVPIGQFHRILESLDIRPTLTAHPTESRRRSVMEKQTRIGDVLVTRDIRETTPVERVRAESEVRRTLSLLLATDEVRSRRLDVIDEVRNGIHYLAGTIWDTVPSLYRDLAEAVRTHYDRPLEFPVLIRYRSWIGGDRDGNPNVTADLTRRTFGELREAAIARHAETLERLRRELSLSDHRVPISQALLDSIQRDEQESPLDANLVRHLQHEPFRVKIRHMQARLGRPDYNSARFIEDLSLLQRAVRKAGLDEVAAEGLLADAIIRARTFGFHLAALDIRQHSRVHEQVVAELLRIAGVESDYAALDEPDRLKVLRNELKTPRPLLAHGVALSPESREMIDTFQVIAEVVRDEPESIGSYIISMSHRVSDLLEVLILLREVGLWRIRDGVVECPIDVAPLFETVDDLRRAAEIMKSLFAEPAYAAHLKARSAFQEIMLGYSDSNKDGGYWAANWRLYRAQDELARACAEAGVSFRFFHGRGGTVARGGGRAHRAIMSSPIGSRNGRIRFTEQGEVISFRYAMPALAHRHIEQIVNAMIRSSVESIPDDVQADDMSPLMDALADRSRAAYRELIDDPEFWPWFTDRSPVQHIGELPIASRPVARSAGELKFENLRAIPWVFAWTQMRYNAPGWFGLGCAFEELVLSDHARLDRCRRAYRADGHFRAFIDNAQQEMARARLLVARWYAGESDQGAAIHQRIADEFERAERAILTITGQGALLDNNPVIQHSIHDRNPDTDLINALQVELLRRWRTTNDRQDQRQQLRSVILLSVNSLAAAMQSTG